MEICDLEKLRGIVFDFALDQSGKLYCSGALSTKVKCRRDPRDRFVE